MYVHTKTIYTKIDFGIDSIKTEMRILFQITWMKRLLLRWNEHPLLQPPTSKIHKDNQTSLCSRGKEIHHSGIWGLDQWTRREGRSTHRIPIRVWTRDAETHPRTENELREKGCWERESQEISQTSFLRSENSDGQLVFDYEKNLRDL